VKHYKFGSSTAARTDACQAWVQQSEGIPRKESTFAIDGTIVHGVLEQMALGEAIPDIVEGHRVEKDHIDMAKVMWADTETVLENHSMTEWEPEVTANVSDDVGGTLDLVARNAFNTCMLLDYKTGMGVQVSPANNKQILFAAANLLYGASSAADLVEGCENFIGVIMQPNRAGEVETREWEFTKEQVDRFWQQHQCNIVLAESDDDLVPVAGDHCKFCPANGLCDATTGNLLRMKQIDPEDAEQLAWALGMISQVEDTIKAVEKLAMEQLEVGVEIPGWKLVRGRAGNTTWDDPDKALPKLKRLLRGCKDDDGNRLAAMLETKKFVTPTQAKKILKQGGVATEFLDEITHRPEPKTNVLAPEDDPRAAVLSADALSDALNSIK
jgi:hypothetical protein